jgi:purine-nucleoside phosphorylase
VGQPVLMADHLNLTGGSPVAGPIAAAVPARFVDLTEAYSARLRALAREVDPSLTEGVYAGLPGPHYETPAEIRMLRILGADLVGMSTVWEAIAARHLGLEVLGLSLVTNPAAGLGATTLDHAEVLEAGRRSAERMGDLLAAVVDRL